MNEKSEVTATAAQSSEQTREVAKKGQSRYTGATGKRKCAVAQVRLVPGGGDVIVNDKPYENLFPRIEHRRTIESPFIITNTVGKFYVTVKVKGGGVSGQAGAIRHSFARALVKENELFKPMLRKAGLLTRDSRIKERKKYGLKRARKAPQYTKR